VASSPGCPPASTRGGTGSGSNAATTVTACSRSASDPSVPTSITFSVAHVSVHRAGTSALLPSGSTTSSSSTPCRRIPPSTARTRPSNGWQRRVTRTEAGNASRRVVCRGFVRCDRPHGPAGQDAEADLGQEMSWRWSRRSARPASSPRRRPFRTATPAPRKGAVRHEGARCEWIALVGGAADAGNVISGLCLEACPHLGMRRW
jgi:hypothetical protein